MAPSAFMNDSINRRNFLKQAGVAVIGLGMAGYFGLLAGAGAQTQVDTRAADQLGWQLAVHSYTFQKFSIFDAIDKTAALGVKYMSISGSVILEGTNRLTTVELSDQQREAINQKLAADGFGSF